MKKQVRKAVIAAAGFGTRFLPQTKAMPKEMLPLIDKPVIQYVVEELVTAGIEDIIIVTGYHKRTIEDHFDIVSGDLKENLLSGNKQNVLEELEKIATLANFIYVRQKGPYGAATPVLNAEHIIGDEPFVYLFADDFMVGSPNRTEQLLSQYYKTPGCILACKKVVEDSEYDRYGIVGGKPLSDDLVEVSRIIEKPGKRDAPGDLASIGGYVLTPDIFEKIRACAKKLSKGAELQIQPAMQMLIDEGASLYGLSVKNFGYYDTGDRLGYLKTIVDLGLSHNELGGEFRNI
ncbi:MAG: sugar phosphate nucleotidyltransferase [Candidatus Saccharimonadales bacterium]